MANLPDEFLSEIKAITGNEYKAFLSAMEQKSEQALRINTLKKRAEQAASEFCESPVPWEPAGRYCLNDTRPGASLAHVCGAFYMQDASAMAPVSALDPKPGETVLDLCAAPGGKSSQIGARLNGSGMLVANEYVSYRAQILRSNLERLGVRNACVTNAASDKIAVLLPEAFDAVLVDAPCSGEGMFRRDPDSINEWTPLSPSGCASRQAEILDNAARTVKNGGRLVYSTCTFNRHENEETVSAFLNRNPAFEPEDFELEGIGKSTGGCLRLWPHKIRGEGHFVCKLRKMGEPAASKPAVLRASKEAQTAFSQAQKQLLAHPIDGNPVIVNDTLWLIPESMPKLDSLYVLSLGLEIGRLQKGRLEPAHALAMALDNESALLSQALSFEEACRFMEGEELKRDCPDGWTLLTYVGLPLGWSKASGGCLKNHLPKGLRLRGGHAIKVR